MSKDWRKRLLPLCHERACLQLVGNRRGHFNKTETLRHRWGNWFRRHRHRQNSQWTCPETKYGCWMGFSGILSVRRFSFQEDMILTQKFTRGAKPEQPLVTNTSRQSTFRPDTEKHKWLSREDLNVDMPAGPPPTNLWTSGMKKLLRCRVLVVALAINGTCPQKLDPNEEKNCYGNTVLSGKNETKTTTMKTSIANRDASIWHFDHVILTVNRWQEGSPDCWTILQKLVLSLLY